MNKWFFFNGLFAWLAYAGLTLNMDGPRNVLFLFAWVNIFISFFSLTEEVAKALKKRGRPVPQWLNVTYDLVLAATFAWFGFWITGLFWLIQLLFQEAAYLKSEKLESCP